MKRLTKEQLAGFRHMFELGNPHFLIITVNNERWFIGVHLYQLDHLVPTEVEGKWSCGRM